MYGAALQDLASAAGAGGAAPASPLGAPPAMPGVGLGDPPKMPGLPPPPTNIGTMPVGDPSTTKKASADQAIMALRQAASNYPALKGQIDQMIDALKAGAKPEPTAALGQPSDPGTAPAPVTPPLDSGAAGPM